ncbi:MAG: Imm43 family immunity protein [Oscillospiraceae bacterium]|nr:Imm43 family immunity protein [Oscillospiraceae bacterium]
MSNNIYATLKPYSGNKEQGLPSDIHMIYTEEFNPDNPMEPLYNTEWLFYRPKKHGIPVPDELRLPAELRLVCKNERKIAFDFYTQETREWLVSLEFLTFIENNNLLAGKYECCKLDVLSTGGKPISKKQYFLFRIFQDDSHLIDWDNTPSIDAKEKPINYDFYPALHFMRCGHFALNVV